MLSGAQSHRASATDRVGRPSWGRRAGSGSLAQLSLEALTPIFLGWPLSRRALLMASESLCLAPATKQNQALAPVSRACGKATRGMLSLARRPPQPSRVAQPRPTFVRMHHALHHLHRVISLQLQGYVPHGVHQLREEVRNVGTVLQEHVAVLAVGEVGVTQVGAAGRKSR